MMFHLKVYSTVFLDEKALSQYRPVSSFFPFAVQQLCLQSLCRAVGMNFEIVTYKDLNFEVLDFGGSEMNRYIWHCYYYTGPTRAIIFVVDCTDRERIDEARTELHVHVLSWGGEGHLPKGLPVLVYANKQDVPKAMSSTEVAGKLGMYELKENPWYVQPRYV